MAGPVSVVVSVAGVLLVLGVVWDVFHTIFHPSGQGRISGAAMAGIWRLTARGGPRLRELAGPSALVAVIVAWVALAVVGWALVYWPHMPAGFVHSSGLDVSGRSTAADALYVSVVTLATLGYGDVVPAATGLRLVAPLEALMGFAILTAAVTWVLQVQPALVRRRTTVMTLSGLRRAGLGREVRTLDADLPAVVLADLAAAVTQVGVDLTQYSETYYFREGEEERDLGEALIFAADLAEAGSASPRADVRLAGRALQTAVDDLAAHAATTFLGATGDTRSVLEALRRDRAKRPG